MCVHGICVVCACGRRQRKEKGETVSCTCLHTKRLNRLRTLSVHTGVEVLVQLVCSFGVRGFHGQASVLVVHVQPVCNNTRVKPRLSLSYMYSLYVTTHASNRVCPCRTCTTCIAFESVAIILLPCRFYLLVVPLSWHNTTWFYLPLLPLSRNNASFT